ncbi:hypothetical protein [Massilia sp. CF038]|uniref:hypothetical protein n=1 Tax=Massilia sp. CF038 TaxID=1881045 RepID=UPI00091C8136|nr:hypothetical protein [Massilia sp. CF038]SHG70595.1 hypothetical protein SAMN05428948_1697 [Massilia sp. CF038]
MKSFLGSALQILLVGNLFAWVVPVVQFADNHFFIAVTGEVVSSERVYVTHSSPQVGDYQVELVEVRTAYVYQGSNYVLKVETSLVDGVEKPLREVHSFYSRGRKILVWIDPNRPYDAKLSRVIQTPVLAYIFLLLLIVTFFFYVRLKSDSSFRS